MSASLAGPPESPRKPSRPLRCRSVWRSAFKYSVLSVLYSVRYGFKPVRSWSPRTLYLSHAMLLTTGQLFSGGPPLAGKSIRPLIRSRLKSEPRRVSLLPHGSRKDVKRVCRQLDCIEQEISLQPSSPLAPTTPHIDANSLFLPFSGSSQMANSKPLATCVGQCGPCPG